MTKIIIQVKPKSQTNPNCLIFFDDGTEIELSMDLVLKNQLTKGKVISFASLADIISAQRLLNAKQTAYNFAAYSPRTKKQIIDKLKKNEFSDVEIENSIKFLADFNLINDVDFAKKFINDYLLKNKAGKAKLLQLLVNKGVDRVVAENAIEDFLSEEKSFEMAILAAEKKLKLISNKSKEKQRQAVYNHLINKGFSFSEAKKVIEFVIK